ncbi:protein ImuA [Sphingobium sp. BHU LFT2]|nr:protein ImuA [Sphingobium sp. BHU LFT2]MBT2246020.1 protein ImuA [Sphingobium sp. BHU LFT2]
MPSTSPLSASLAVSPIAKLREAVGQTRATSAPCLPFDINLMDEKLAAGGVDGSGLHEFAARAASLSDDAAATLFLAGIAARFAADRDQTVCWAMTTLDLYAVGLEQVGLGPDKLLYAQGRMDVDVLAIAEDALRDGSLACVIAEVKTADMTATRRLQLAASDGQTPMLLYRRHRMRDRCPLASPSSAMTRWRIGCVPSERLPWPGVGRSRWQVELVRQRNGDPFSLELEACDATGRLAVPAPSRDRAAAPRRADARDGAISRAA